MIILDMITMKHYAFLFSWIFPLLVTAQNTYVKTIGTGESDFGTSCVELPDFGAALTICGGSASGNVQFGLVRTDYNGSVQWKKMFGYGALLYPEQVVSTTDGGFLIFGNKKSHLSAGNAGFLLKTDPDGNELWMKSIAGSADDRAAGLIACQNGGYVTCSVIDDNGTGQYAGALLVKYNESGAVVWSKQFRGYFDNKPVDLTELPDGSIAFVSSTRITFGDSFNHILVTKVTSGGTLLWSNSFSRTYDDDPSAIVADGSGNLYITGRTYTIGSEWDGFLLKVNAQGESVFNRIYNAGTASGEMFRDLAVRADGSVLLLGDLGAFEQRDITLLSTGTNGQVLWSKRYPLSVQYTNYPYDLFLSYQNGIVFTGDVRSPAYVRDAALVRTDSFGNIPCFNEDMSYTTFSEPFQRLSPPFTPSEPVLSIIDVTPAHPAEIITEKIVCENPLPPGDFEQVVGPEGQCPAVCLHFLDKTLGSPESWTWEFEGADPEMSHEQHPHVCYPVGGTYTVRLTVENASGSSTMEKSIEVGNNCPPLPVPNIVSPNGDGVNDFFFISGLPANSVFHIVNRWGEEVFVSDEEHQQWDGKDKSGKAVLEGVYFYRLETPQDLLHGFVHLFR